MYESSRKAKHSHTCQIWRDNVYHSPHLDGVKPITLIFSARHNVKLRFTRLSISRQTSVSRVFPLSSIRAFVTKRDGTINVELSVDNENARRISSVRYRELFPRSKIRTLSLSHERLDPSRPAIFHARYNRDVQHLSRSRYLEITALSDVHRFAASYVTYNETNAPPRFREDARSTSFYHQKNICLTLRRIESALSFGRI